MKGHREGGWELRDGEGGAQKQSTMGSIYELTFL